MECWSTGVWEYWGFDPLLHYSTTQYSRHGYVLTGNQAQRR